MRIGIITLPLASNYGGILQNYALQRILLRLGHNPTTIDYFPRKNWGERIKHIVWSFLHFKKPNTWYLPLVRSQIAKEFIQQNIETTHLVRRYRVATIKKYGFDILIAGSDQIWRPAYNKHLSDMYFNFGKRLPIKKVFYGASFGTDTWEYDSRQTRQCRTLIHQVDAVSVREKSGIDMCRRYFEISAQWVLDPTLLLKASDYEHICTRVPHSSYPFLAAYILDMDDQVTKQIKIIGKSLNLPIQFFTTGASMDLPIEEWLAMFRDAQYVITDSFHGTVFSIIFNKPFISIGNNSRGMSRFVSLLEQFDLRERLSPEISMDRLLQPIAWGTVNRLRRELKDDSIDFLKTNLKR